MREDALFIGVDGGGTKTALGAYDTTGRCVASSTAGALNYNFIGTAAALEHLRQGLEALGVARERILAVGIGDPSIDDLAMGGAALRFAAQAGELLGVPVYIRSDAYMTLYGLTRGERAGVLVISGTGAMAIGEDAQRRVCVAGGWGRLTGDEGSGYYIGLQGLRRALMAADGVAPSTALTAAALAHFGAAHPRALIDVMYGEDEPDVAGFARAVAACAEAGDAAADEVLTDAADYLARYTLRLLEACGADVVGVYGSVLCRNATVRARFEAQIRKSMPHVSVTEPAILAECAAALYAAKQYQKEEQGNQE